MLKRKKKKGINGAGLLLLAVFLNLFFVQLACSLPHVMQRLEPLASAHVHQDEDEHTRRHSHDKATSDTDSHHHDSESDSHNSCCSEQPNTHFLKSFQDSGWSSAVKVKEQPSSLALLAYAFDSSSLQASMVAVSHTPPDDLPPKIPDIRIFLQSLILFDVL